MLKYFRKTLNPDGYHGQNVRPPFFEGWYFKLVDAAERRAMAVIPGIFQGRKADQSEAFIQVMDSAHNAVSYVRFNAADFQSQPGEFDIRIGRNYFTGDRIGLDIRQSGIAVSGELQFENRIGWPVTLLSPGIMGWYAWAPFMQCYHGVVSMNHRISGQLRLNGEKIDFSGGRGYTEKDWGRSFPESWVWLQCNHFAQADISVTLSIAIIPWIRGEFPGFIAGILHRGKLYRFATYTGARIVSFSVNETGAAIVLRDRRHLLKVNVTRSANTALLHAPTAAGMTRRIAESLSSTVFVTLEKRSGSALETIFQGEGKHAGFEAVGDLERLIGMWKAGSNNA